MCGCVCVLFVCGLLVWRVTRHWLSSCRCVYVMCVCCVVCVCYVCVCLCVCVCMCVYVCVSNKTRAHVCVQQNNGVYVMFRTGAGVLAC